MNVVRSSLHSGQYYLGTLIWRMSVYPLILIGLPHFGHWGLFIASPLRISLLHSLHFHACIFSLCPMMTVISIRFVDPQFGQ